jgi:hypothetical protein
LILLKKGDILTNMYNSYTQRKYVIDTVKLYFDFTFEKDKLNFIYKNGDPASLTDIMIFLNENHDLNLENSDDALEQVQDIIIEWCYGTTFLHLLDFGDIKIFS